MKEFYPESQEILDGMSRQELEDLWDRLRLFASKYFWLQYAVRGGYDLEWLIIESIEDAYFGVRRKPPNLSIGQFLCGIIRSKADHLWEKEKKRVSIEKDFEDLSFEETWLERSRVSFPHLIRSNEDSFQLVRYKELSDKIRDLVSQDEVLLKIVETLIQEPDLKPREIAAKLNLLEKDIRKAQKRLRRKVKHLRGVVS